MENVLFATAALWIMELLLVCPLAALFSRRRALQPVVADGIAAAPEATTTTDTGSYVLASVLVLGTAGLLLGLAGYWFVGFSLKAKAWPGMLAFIGLSLLGFQMSKGF
jgi:hypothetical protein